MKNENKTNTISTKRFDKDFEGQVPAVRRRVVVDMDADGNVAKATEYRFNERLQRWESMGDVSKSAFVSATYEEDEPCENAPLNDSE